ncbi:MAG: toprim domain-containing protein [Alphaproteobacteria bacterium]|nr:toprim domain-containing protein [Alphaproteobacteria bacterium]
MIDFNDVAPAPAKPIHYDLDVIVARLRDTAEHWVPQDFPNGRRNGDEWRLANIRGDAPRKNGSCVITLKGDHAGDWIDFDGGQGGGPLSTLEQRTGLSGRDLFAHAADMTGWTDTSPPRQEPARAPKSNRDPANEISFILSHAKPLKDTPVSDYLTDRGLTIPDGADLKFHADLTHWETKTGLPALIAIVRDHAGVTVAIHRTYLHVDETSNTVTKANVAKPRMMLGKVAGGAVRLAKIGPDGVLGLCEGIETGLAVMTACPGLAVWATLSTTNLEQVHLPPEATRIIILADHDVSGAGSRAAETAARRLRSEDRTVSIAMPQKGGEDFNDLLLRKGPDVVAQVIQSAQENDAEDEPEVMGRHIPVGFVYPAASQPTLRADEGDLARAVDRAWSLLLTANQPPWLFRTAGLPTWIVPDDEGRPFASTVTEERLRYMLAKIAQWRRIGRTGELVPTSPPTALIKSLLATPDPGLPILSGIVSTPVFGRGGTLLTEPGYHPDARLLYHAMPGFKMPAVSEYPSPEQIAEARELLQDDLFGDFPFTSLAERAHAISLLLLGFVRALINGSTPLHLIEKPSPGTGATLMVDAISTILTGTGTLVMTESRDDEEWRKRITAKLRQIPAIVLIDNLRGKLDSSALAAALTAPFWEDRILGVSETIRLPIRCTWIATGNNPEFSNEMARRLVRIRLDARVDQPWRREAFKHPDLMGWVRANRARLVAACLTLCRAWISAGRPRGQRSIGSYEAWAQTMGGILEVAGIEGFLENLDDMMAASDSEGAMWRGFISSWWDRFGTAEVGSSDLYDLAITCEPPLPLGSGNERSQRTRLGKSLGRMRDRVFAVDGRSLHITAAGVKHQAQRWHLSIDENIGTDKRSPRSPDEAVGGERLGVDAQRSPQRSPAQPIENKGSGERGERGERFFLPYTCAGAHAPVKETSEKRSQRSQCSLTDCKSTDFEGERAGERQNERSPLTNPPDWLKEVM